MRQGIAEGRNAGGARAPDFSGVYDCTGDDHKEGAYTGTVTLARVPEHSVGRHVAYRFTLEVPGYGTYVGQAVSRGATLAIHFALPDPSTKDYGTGIATVRTEGGRTRFHKFYYEPEFKGGNHGTEDCVRRRS